MVRSETQERRDDTDGFVHKQPFRRTKDRASLRFCVYRTDLFSGRAST
ncbi:hypothetical protein HMPREF9141_0180 [Prevotella multiformis DSM 16608]|uniref:Uncharacterized protein n=1 Tax=Prevotella multiformis DSM 16608 TaxID=888743 RepID=F0F3L4_9BACT|nr:hypothetical protein HMPREF9141_0180 [Prevotella multiformis DSM 16608]